MATQDNRYQSGHRNVTPPGKKAAVVLGLIVAGYVAGAIANHALPQLNGIGAFHLRSPEAKPGAEIAVSTARLSTNALPARGARNGENGWVSEPRECRPDAGLVIECIFN